MGKKASEERGEGRFPEIDFCSSPEAICADGQGGESTEDIKWIVGFFEWVERIQLYKDWDYLINLQNFVDGGSTDNSFIDAVSSIFTQGCPSSYCSSTMEVTKLKERRENFIKLLGIFRYSEPTPSPMAPTTPSPSPESFSDSNIAGTGNAPSTPFTPQWEFDPTIPTTQQWNGNSPIDSTPTWALEYYGNPPAQIIPTLDGYNPTTEQWNANVPAQFGPFAPVFWAVPSMQGFAPSVITTQQWEFDPTIPTTQQWNGNSPIDVTPTWALEYYGNPPAEIIPTLEGYDSTTQQWNENVPSQLAPAWEGNSPSLPTNTAGTGNAPSTPFTPLWEFDPTIPTTQQWNGNSPIDSTPTWALEYYGNPPAQIIPTLDGYNPTTEQWNVNVPAQLAPFAPVYWEQSGGNSFPTTQQGSVPSLPTTNGWTGNSPTQVALWPEGNDVATPSSQLTSDATTTSSQGEDTPNKDILTPIEDSSGLILSPTALWMTSLAIGVLF